MDSLINIYDELGIPEFSDINVLKAGIRKVKIKYHPDKFVKESLEFQKQNAEYLGQLCQICNYLYDEENKVQYDNLLKMKLSSKDTEDITSLLKQKYDLQIQLYKIRQTLLLKSLDSEEYKNLKISEEKTSNDIIHINHEINDLDKKIKLTHKLFEQLFLVNGIFDFPEIFEKYRSDYNCDINNLNNQKTIMNDNLLATYKLLEQIRSQIRNFPTEDYYMSDPEYFRVNNLLNEIKLKINTYEYSNRR